MDMQASLFAKDDPMPTKARKPWSPPQITVFSAPDELSAAFEQVDMPERERARLDHLIGKMRRAGREPS